jgi:hypothetical protein
MFEGDDADRITGLLGRLDTVIDELLDTDLTGLGGESVLDLLRGLEVRQRRFATVDHVIVAEADTRALGRERGCPRTATLLAQLLKITAGEASARVRAARELAPRRALTGELMPARYARVAAAQAAGDLNSAQARVITRMIEALPAQIRDQHFDTADEFLVGQAPHFTPDTLTTIATHLSEVLNPDGLRPIEHGQDRNRHLTLHQRIWGHLPLAGEAPRSGPSTWTPNAPKPCWPSWTRPPNPNPKPAESPTPAPPDNAATTDSKTPCCCSYAPDNSVPATASPSPSCSP